jgi:hypothetical protein
MHELAAMSNLKLSHLAKPPVVAASIPECYGYEQEQRCIRIPSEKEPIMLALQEESNGKLITVQLSGKLTKEDYEHFVPRIESAIKQNGKVRMLVQMHEFHGWELGALWEDVKFDAKHFTDIERLALVGESKWEAGMAAFCRPFTTASIKYFDHSKEAEAETWIREGLAA